MRSKAIKYGAILLLCVCMILVAALLIFNRKEESVYSFYHIPVGDGDLSWGMSVDEVISVMGEPTSVEDSEYGAVLTYDSPMSSEIGSCSNLVLGVGIDEPVIKEGARTLPKGLCMVIMEVAGTTREATIEKLTAIYGDLTGGSTNQERMLQEIDPDYFNARYYCDEWKAGTLSEEEYTQLVQAYQIITSGRPMDKENPLMDIRISSIIGAGEGDVYTCNVSLDAYVFSCLEKQ